VAVFNPYLNYYGFYIYINSIYWKEYKLKNKKCCALQYHENCEIPCNYSIEVVLYGIKLPISNHFKGIENKNYNLGIGIIFPVPSRIAVF
ncbi:hypothetical protein HZS_6479, partial [Henneguya salminicola]